MKPQINLIFILLHLGLLAAAQSDEKFEVKAIDRQFIRKKDTTYRFYAIVPENPVKTRPDRTYFWYRSDTILSTAGGYDGRLLNGPFTSFYPDNNLKEEGTFRNGLRSGEWKSWYPGGKIRSITKWSQGVRSGAFTEYDEEGRLRREGRYSDDRLSGFIKDYSADGKSSVVRYRNGEPVPSREKRRAKDRAQTKPVTEQQPARSEKKKKKKETDQ